MNTKTTQLLAIVILVALVALLSVTFAYAYTARMDQYNGGMNQYMGNNEDCDESMEQQMHGNAAFEGHHGAMHGETQNPDNTSTWRGCH